ncbi:MAG TPA: ABC transporter permease, partial [Bryobacteraceae bacterium]|nr:ABC transporter permease [Bryobacteraceae bacterium]
MRYLRAWFVRICGLFNKAFREGELAAEMESHLQLHIEDNLCAGMTPQEARRQALLRLGGLEQTKENYRERRGLRMLESFFQDLRFAFRMLLKNPGFTTIAVLTLAIGVGANTAIFSLLDGLVLKPLAVPHPEELVQFGARSLDGSYTALSLPMFDEITRHQEVFSDTFAWWGDGVFNVQANRELIRADVWAVTGDYYSQLGAKPEIGRLLEPRDADLNSGAPNQLAVLGYEFWRTHYGGARDTIGKIVEIEGLPFTIVGVTRKGFGGMSPVYSPQVTVPLTAEPLIVGDPYVQKHLQRPDALWLNAAGRLKPSVSVGQARAQLTALWPAILDSIQPAIQTPVARNSFLKLQLGVESDAKGDFFLRRRFANPLYALLGIAALVLLLACVNLASLMLARAAARTHEMGLRLALGASRHRLAQQMLTESVTLSLAGTLVGFILASWCSETLSNFILGEIWIVPAALNLKPDGKILGFTAAAAILTGVLFGLVPAWRATREDPRAALQRNSRSIGRGMGRLGKGLVITQVALSLVLLAGAGLFIRSLQNLRAAHPGFQIRGMLEIPLFPRPNAFKNVDRVSYFHDLIDRVSSLPGVASAGMEHMEIGNLIEWSEKARVAGTSDQDFAVDCEMAMPGFFRTTGISLLQGRTFTWQDDDHASHVALVSENFAQRAFPDGNAIGRRIEIATKPKWGDLQIVGIVSNASLYDVRKPPQPTVYIPTTQYGDYADNDELLVRTNVPPDTMRTLVQGVLNSIGREDVMWVKPLSESVGRSILQERLTAMLSGFFGGLGLLLALIGLYGLMAYTVTRRTQEIGIRLALGAQRRQVRRMILGETLVLVLLGVAIGVPCALATTRL